MVAKRMLPRASTSGSALGSSVVSPLPPNHTPPVFWRAASTPTARPPGAAPRRGKEIRFETQTRRFNAPLLPPTIKLNAWRERWFPSARLHPSHAGPEAHFAGRTAADLHG